MRYLHDSLPIYGLSQRRRERARQDLARAAGGQHLLAVAQHALLVHHQADHAARGASGLLRLELFAADEVAAFVQRHGPAERCFPARAGFHHVLAVQVQATLPAPGFEPTPATGLHAPAQARIPPTDYTAPG